MKEVADSNNVLSINKASCKMYINGVKLLDKKVETKYMNNIYSATFKNNSSPFYINPTIGTSFIDATKTPYGKPLKENQLKEQQNKLASETATKNALTAIRKANPKMIVKIWDAFIVSKYTEEIESGNIDFFINKDYSQDISNASNSDKIMESIDRLRQPVKNMGPENQAKVMKYIQNLTKLAKLCDK